MCRITCDRCRESSFDVHTFDKSIEPPEGWMNVTSYGWGSTGYSRTDLCCPKCVGCCSRDDKVNNPGFIQIEERKFGY